MKLIRKFATLMAAAACVLLAGAAWADPPYRVARLAYESGNVVFSPAGEAEWSRAVLNRPLFTGDRLWVGDRSRAELQLGATAVRIGDQASVSVLNVDDHIAQLQLTQGTIEVRVWDIGRDQSVEIDTPNLAFVVRQPGSYRVDVDARDGSTGVTVRNGSALLYGDRRAFRIGPSDTWRFYDTALADYDTYRASPPDDLARWAFARDQRWQRSVSARYVSRDMIGFDDLDEYGTWRQVPDYGWVWTPTRVSADWAPYRDGHWSWIEPWGWTWVDDAPWGFASSHYGRWAFVQDRWSWVPGPVQQRPVYAPALVAFVAASNGVVGWFPLAPREVYRPAYHVSRDYFTRVNVTNTAVNVTQVVNVFERRDTERVTYVNQRAPRAVVAVPVQAFTQARPVAREAVQMQAQAQNVQAQPVVAAPPVAPARQSVFGPQPAAQRPPEQAFRRQVVAQTAPPPPAAPIESKLQALQAHPGQPLAPASAPVRPQATASAAAPAPAVKVVAPTQPASAPPPPAASASRPERERRREEQHGDRPAAPASQSAAPPAAPAAASQSARPPVAPAASAPTPAPAARGATPAPTAPAANAASDRSRDEQRNRGNERERGRPPVEPQRPAAASAPAAPAPAAPAPAAPARATPPVTPPETPAKAPAPAQPAPPAPPQRTAPPPPQATPVAPPQAAPSAPPQRASEPAREQRREQREEPRREAPPPPPPRPAAAPQPPSPPAAAAPHAPPPPAAAPPAPPQAAHPQPGNARAEERRQAASEARQEREQERGRRP